MHNVTGRAGVLRGLAGPQNSKNRGGTPLPIACSPSNCRLRSWGKIKPKVYRSHSLDLWIKCVTNRCLGGDRSVLGEHSLHNDDVGLLRISRVCNEKHRLMSVL